MSKQNKSTQVGNRIILNGTALLLLAYMLAKIVQAYIAGGADAPSVKVLLLGIVVLGGGIVKGSVTLLSGEPGIGKSTLLLQICGVLRVPEPPRQEITRRPDPQPEDTQEDEQ